MLATLVVAALGHAFYQDKIPNGHNVKDGLGNPVSGVGHVRTRGGGQRNPFGEAFADAGFQWTTALCNADSDNDGLTNGVELGDPSCVWTPGQQPSHSIGITHPGISSAPTGPHHLCDGTPIYGDPPAPPDACDTHDPQLLGMTTHKIDVTMPSLAVTRGGPDRALRGDGTQRSLRAGVDSLATSTRPQAPRTVTFTG